jgi:hypothetical protein
MGAEAPFMAAEAALMVVAAVIAAEPRRSPDNFPGRLIRQGSA